MSSASSFNGYGSIIIQNDDEGQVFTIPENNRYRRNWVLGGSLLILCTAIAVTLAFMFRHNDDEDTKLIAFRPKNDHNHYPVVWYSTSDETTITIPFSQITRNSGSIVDWSLFGNEAMKTAFPTGAFWTNLILVQTTANKGYSYPIMVYPYGYAWNDQGGLQVSYPSQYRLTNDENSVRDIFIPDFTLKVGTETNKKRKVTHFDPLSVTLQFSDHDKNDDSWWRSYLVPGSPYVTIKYQNVNQPTLHALSIFTSVTSYCQTANCDRDEEKVRQQGRQQLITGSCFTIQTPQSSWRLWTSGNVTLVYDTIHKTTIKTTANTTISGVWRLAYLHEEDDEDYLSKYVSIYPTNAKIQYSSEGGLKFDYTTQRMNDDNNRNGKDLLLLLALPHHVDVFSSSKTQFLSTKKTNSDTSTHFSAATSYRTIKGNMTGVLGSTWIMKYNLPPMGEEEYLEAVDAATRTTILEQVTKDITRVLPEARENVYGYGKQVARLAQLIHIAKVLKGCEETSIHQATTTLFHFVTMFLEGKNDDFLVYDTSFGGVITTDGLNDFMGDFGNGWYNGKLVKNFMIFYPQMRFLFQKSPSQIIIFIMVSFFF